MARRLQLVVGGLDLTEQVSRTEYTVTYEERAGNNAGMMLNGDMTLDIIARRPVIVWPMNYLSSQQLSVLQQVIYAQEYVEVSYFDTVMDSMSTGYFHATIGEQRLGILKPTGPALFHGPVLTLTGR